MWPSVRHWLGSLMNNPWILSRRMAQPQALHYAWERAGHVCAGDGRPVAWCAEAVAVEALVRLPASLGRDKADFSVRVGGATVPADQLRCVEGDRFRVGFRFPPPPASCAAEVLFRGRPMAQLALPVISREQYVAQVSLEMPTAYVRLGPEAVACRTFVAGQCKGLLASAVLVSPAGLLPLLDLDLEVEFKCERSGATQCIPARLTSSQLQGKSALVSVAPPRHPRRQGTWSVTWLLGGRELARAQVRAISRKAFERSLRISDSRFVVQAPGSPCRLARQAPPPSQGLRVGPCFLVASGEPGMAGSCKLQVVANVPGAVQSPLLLEQDVLITDGPAVVAPGTLDAADLAQVTAFELRTAGGPVGLLPLCPVPSATFTGEGGFAPPPEYTWTAAAEEEMQDRLNRLLGE